MTEQHTDHAAAQAIAHRQAPEHEGAREAAGTHPRGESSRLGPNADTAPTRFPPETSGVPEKNSGHFICGNSFENCKVGIDFGGSSIPHADWRSFCRTGEELG